MTSTLTKHQTKKFTRKYADNKGRHTIELVIRYDDECGNGHNSFAMTATTWRGHSYYSDRNFECGGSCHDEIARHFPEYAHYLKWHYMASDGPLHYIKNTIYLSGEKDYHGKRKGEPASFEKRLKFDGFPITYKVDKRMIAHLESGGSLDIVPIVHKKDGGYDFKDKFTFQGLCDEWFQCPFDTRRDAEEFKAALLKGWSLITEPTLWSEGKEPDLEAARSAAIWPDATLAQLQDKSLLEARLPALIAEFKTDMETIGFTF